MTSKQKPCASRTVTQRSIDRVGRSIGYIPSGVITQSAGERTDFQDIRARGRGTTQRDATASTTNKLTERERETKAAKKAQQTKTQQSRAKQGEARHLEANQQQPHRTKTARKQDSETERKKECTTNEQTTNQSQTQQHNNTTRTNERTKREGGKEGRRQTDKKSC